MLLKTLSVVTVACVFLFAAINFSACGNSNTKQNIKHDTIPRLTEKDITIPGNFSNQRSLKFDSSLIGLFLKQYQKLQPFKKDIDSFYRRRNYAFAWYDNAC